MLTSSIFQEGDQPVLFLQLTPIWNHFSHGSFSSVLSVQPTVLLLYPRTVLLQNKTKIRLGLVWRIVLILALYPNLEHQADLPPFLFSIKLILIKTLQLNVGCLHFPPNQAEVSFATSSCLLISQTGISTSPFLIQHGWILQIKTSSNTTQFPEVIAGFRNSQAVHNSLTFPSSSRLAQHLSQRASLSYRSAKCFVHQILSKKNNLQFSRRDYRFAHCTTSTLLPSECFLPGTLMPSGEGKQTKKRSVLKLLQIVYTREKQEVHWQHEHKAESHLHLPDTKSFC